MLRMHCKVQLGLMHMRLLFGCNSVQRGHGGVLLA